MIRRNPLLTQRPNLNAQTQIPSPHAILILCPNAQTSNLLPPPLLQIITIVRPHLADDVLDALRRAPVEAVTVQEVKGYGRQKSYLDQYQPTEYDAAFVPKVEITLWVDPARSEEVIDKIIAVARSGRIGDGKIMVLPTVGIG